MADLMLKVDDLVAAVQKAAADGISAIHVASAELKALPDSLTSLMAKMAMLQSYPFTAPTRDSFFGGRPTDADKLCALPYVSVSGTIMVDWMSQPSGGTRYGASPRIEFGRYDQGQVFRDLEPGRNYRCYIMILPVDEK